MGELVERYRGVSLVSRGDPFATLARSIVGQQISVKAADAVWGRTLAHLGEITPQRVMAQGRDGMSGCGLSARKIEYLHDLASHFLSGALVPALWLGQDDESVIQALTAVRGIGRWTAEMFLIFNLMRPDVYPLDDIGLQRAVAEHYLAGVRPSRLQLRDIGERWRPWRSVATWHLWRSLDPVPVAY